MRFLFSLIFGLLLGGSSLVADILYTVTALGALPGGFSQGYGINNAGQVTGWSSIGSSSGGTSIHAFLYSNGQMTDITAGQVGPQGYSAGYAVNSAGQVAGFAELTVGGQYLGRYAVIYSNGQVTNLGGFYSYGYGINDAGQVTGDSVASDGTVHAFLYSNGQMTDLGPGIGFGINNAGQITGESATASGDVHAFLYSNGQMIDLGFGVGMAINNAGQVAGGDDDSSRFFPNSDPTAHGRAYLYSNGQRIDLGPGVGIALNNAGQVVGAAYASPGDTSPSAFLYTNGQAYNLNDLIDPSLHLFLEEATAINDQGQIVVNGSGGAHLLTPVPEPDTWTLFGVALAGLSFWRYRRVIRSLRPRLCFRSRAAY